MPHDPVELLPGTLELLVLKALSLEPMHGWGIGHRIAQLSNDVFDVQQGSLYPALQRMLRKGLGPLRVARVRQQPARPLLHPHPRRLRSSWPRRPRSGSAPPGAVNGILQVQSRPGARVTP